MIVGIGTDLLEIARVERLHDRFGRRLAERILMSEELDLFDRAKRPVRFLAMHFAAKEAIVKAMGTGFANGIWVRDVGFVPDPRGKPLVITSARGQAVQRRLGVGAGHVSLTDEAGFVVAFAVLEAQRSAPGA